MNEHFSAMHKIIYIAKTHHSVIEAKMTEVGMHRSTHMMLTYISSCQTPPPQKEIAEKLKISPAAVAATLERLEADGYIEKAPAAGDHRVKGVKITESGRAVLSKTCDIFSETDGITFAGLEGDEFAAFCKSLDVIAENLTKMKQNIKGGDAE